MISTKRILILLLIFEAHGNVNSKAGAEHEPKLEHLLCSVNSRIIQLENEIDGMKSSCDSTGDGILSGEASTLISALRSQVDSLQKSSVEEKVKELEQRIQQIGLNFVPSEIETELDDSCKDLDIGKHQPKSFLYYLPRINFNIFLNKPTNASSTYQANSNHKAENGINEDYNNYVHSAKEDNPWVFVDLKEPHLIWEIQITFREKERSGALKIYVANEVIFDSHGKPDMKYLPAFASQSKPSLNKLTMSFTHPKGMCGRYVIVTREVSNEFLIFFELKGIGYSFGQN